MTIAAMAQKESCDPQGRTGLEDHRQIKYLGPEAQVSPTHPPRHKASFLITDILRLATPPEVTTDKETETTRQDGGRSETDSEVGDEIGQRDLKEDDEQGKVGCDEQCSSLPWPFTPIPQRKGRSNSPFNFKRRKSRTAFTDYQLETLERSFERHKYLSVQDRYELAAQLKLSGTQIKTWYQNRRTKWKRESVLPDCSPPFLLHSQWVYSYASHLANISANAQVYDNRRPPMPPPPLEPIKRPPGFNLGAPGPFFFPRVVHPMPQDPCSSSQYYHLRRNEN